MSLVARYLEEHGIPTVVIGSAKDIVEHCGVPRFLFSDFPLGNPCGHPWRPEMQEAIVGQALRLLETATSPRTTAQAPFAWKPDAWYHLKLKVQNQADGTARIQGKAWAAGDEVDLLLGHPASV